MDCFNSLVPDNVHKKKYMKSIIKATARKGYISVSIVMPAIIKILLYSFIYHSFALSSI